MVKEGVLFLKPQQAGKSAVSLAKADPAKKAYSAGA